MAVKQKRKQVRVTAAHIAEARAGKARDTSPKWENAAQLSGEEFAKLFRESMQYYNLEYSAKDLKPAVLKWMAANGYAASDIALFKKIKDFRCGATMGALASCLNKGMPVSHPQFNSGRCSAEWLKQAIAKVLEAGRNDLEEEEKAAAPAGPVLSIQERVKEAALSLTDEIEDALDSWQRDPDSFDPKAFKVLNMLKGKGAKAAHARIIRDLYATDFAELQELASGKGDEQLREAYSYRSRKQIKALIEFYTEIQSACDMLLQEAKVVRKPRARKPVDKAKLVAKLKYKKTDDTLKLVSINPVDILGASEVWVYNTKTRKIGKYVAAEFAELSVKGTTIIGFDPVKSIQKTLRKPAEQLAAFKAAGKVALRKFLDGINAVDIVLNGRVNEEIVILKAA